jgi:polar amino acid transport system permease protein
MPLGLVLGVARVSPWPRLRWPVAVLVQIVRAVPLLLVVFWAYFFLPA